MHKRILSLFTAGTLLLSFSACGNQTTANNTNTSSVTESSVASADNDSSAEGNAVSSANTSSSAAETTIYTGTIRAIDSGSITIATETEEMTFHLTENTAYRLNFPKGEMPDGEMPQKPDGEFPDGEMPQKPDGEFPDGEMPQKPDGEFPDGEMPQKPDGEFPDGEMPQKFDAKSDGGENKVPTITADNLSEGDNISVEADENSNAVSITLMND